MADFEFGWGGWGDERDRDRERDRDPFASLEAAGPVSAAPEALQSNEGFGFGQVGGGLNFGPVAEGGRVGSLEHALGAAVEGARLGGGEDLGLRRPGAGVNWADFQQWLSQQPRPGQEQLARRPGGPLPGTTALPGSPVGGAPVADVRAPGGPLDQPVRGGPAAAQQPSARGAVDYGVPDITELRAEPWTTEFEQAAIARADELVRERYNALRQQRAEDMARRGVTPDSPFYMSEMRKVDAEQAKELAGFRRNLQIEKIDRRQRNLAQARQVEALIDAMERQRLGELYSLVSGMPYQTDPAIGQLLAQQGALQQAGQADMWGGVGDLIGAWMNRPQQQTSAGAPWVNQAQFPGMAGLQPFRQPTPNEWQRAITQTDFTQ